VGAIEKALLSLGKKSPFYYYLLLGIKMVPSKSVRNLKLAFSREGDVILYYNEENVAKKPERMVEALLLHEVMHLVLQHFLLRPKDERDKKIWDLAMDAAVNQYIPELSAFGVPIDVLIREGHGVDNDVLFAIPPDWMWGENAEKYHDWMLEEMEKMGRFDVEVVTAFREGVDDHSGLFEEDLPVEMILELTKEHVGKAFNLYGKDLPGNLKREVLIALENPELDWKTLLRRFFGVSVLGDRYSTPLRPNRRYDHLPGWRNEYLARVSVVLDTSGSIVEEEINRFLAELEKIARTVREDIWLVQIDRDVTAVTRYKAGTWKRLEIFGGGGTDLQPALDYTERVLRSEGTVVFTDGHADVPLARRRVMFVLSKYHSEEFKERARKLYGRDAVVVLR